MPWPTTCGVSRRQAVRGDEDHGRPLAPHRFRTCRALALLVVRSRSPSPPEASRSASAPPCPSPGPTRRSARTSSAATSSAPSEWNRGVFGRRLRVRLLRRASPGTGARLFYEKPSARTRSTCSAPTPRPSPRRWPTWRSTGCRWWRRSASTTSIFRKGAQFVFMVQSPAVYLEGLVDMAVRRGLKTIALVNEDTLFPKATVNGTIEPPAAGGSRSSSSRPTPKGNTDFSAIMTKLRAANPDVLGAATYFDEKVRWRSPARWGAVRQPEGVSVGGFTSCSGGTPSSCTARAMRGSRSRAGSPRPTARIAR